MQVPFLATLALAAHLAFGGAPAAARPAPAPVAVVAQPTVTSFSPAYGVPGTTITLTGTDFTTATTVQVNGATASFTVVSATTITATVPAGATTGPLHVTTPDGTGDSAAAFTVVTNSPANCWLDIPLADVATTDVPIYVSGEAGTLGSGATLTSVDLSLFHTWDADLEISLISPAGQTVMLSYHHGYRGHNYGNPFNCPTEVTHFTDAAPTAISAGSPPYTGSFRPDAPLAGFSAGSPNGVWTLRVTDTDGGDTGKLEYLKLNFTTPVPDLVVSTAATVPAGSYHNLTVTGTGSALLGGAVTVEGTLLVQSGGALHTACQPISGPGSFTLEAGATLSICDPAGITSGGSSGAIQLTGTRSFSNDALYYYNGSTAQVTGTGLPTTVRQLTLANAAGLTLTYSLTVTSQATLADGVLTTDDRQLALGDAATLSETPSSYVSGLVQATRTLAAAGTDAFGGLGLTLTAAPGSAAFPGVTQVLRTTGTALAGAGGSHSIKRFYRISPATNAGLSVTMLFGYAEAELAGIAENELTLFNSDTGASPWQAAGYTSRDATANTVTLDGIEHFGTFTLGSTAAPLPIELVAFTAQQQQATAALRWTTALEKDNDHFEVQVALDGLAFRPVGTVAGHGSTSARHDYYFDDAQLLRYGAPQLYYRLRQVNRDGTASYSPVRAVAVAPVEAARATLAVYPTLLAPGETLRYAFSGPTTDQGAEALLFSAAGQRLPSPRLAPAPGEVALPALPAGWYLLKLVLADGQVLTTRFGVR